MRPGRRHGAPPIRPRPHANGAALPTRPPPAQSAERSRSQGRLGRARTSEPNPPGARVANGAGRGPIVGRIPSCLRLCEFDGCFALCWSKLKSPYCTPFHAELVAIYIRHARFSDACAARRPLATALRQASPNETLGLREPPTAASAASSEPPLIVRTLVAALMPLCVDMLTAPQSEALPVHGPLHCRSTRRAGSPTVQLYHADGLDPSNQAVRQAPTTPPPLPRATTSRCRCFASRFSPTSGKSQ